VHGLGHGLRIVHDSPKGVESAFLAAGQGSSHISAYIHPDLQELGKFLPVMEKTL